MSTPTITWTSRIAPRARDRTRNYRGYAPRFAESNINDDHGRPGRLDYSVLLLPPETLTLTATGAPVADGFTERLLGGVRDAAVPAWRRRLGARPTATGTAAWTERLLGGVREVPAAAWTERLLGGVREVPAATWTERLLGGA